MSAHRVLSDETIAKTVRPLYNDVVTQYDVASSDTLADVPGLGVQVSNGKTYRLSAWVFTTVGATGGVKVAVGAVTGQLATANPIIADVTFWDYTTPAITGARLTALNTAASVSTGAVVTFSVQVEATFTATADGAIGITFAQKTSDATNSSVLVGSRIKVEEIGYPIG